MDYDKFLDKIGQFGPYQRRHVCLLAMTGFLSTFSTMGYVFLAAVPDHWCAAPDQFSNFSLEQRKALTLPLEDNGEYSRCTIYDFSSLNYTMRTTGHYNMSSVVNMSSIPVVQCDEWEYDTTLYSNTAVTKWNLVCGQQWIAATIGAANGFGKLAFAIVASYLADRFGRKKILVAMTTIKCVVGVLSAFSPHPFVLVVAFGIMAGASLAGYQCAFLLIIELVGVKWRELSGILIYVFWSIGCVVLAVVAYFLRDWVTRQIVLHASLAIFVVLYVWLTPESPRWLLQKGRAHEAKKILKSMAEINGIKLDENLSMSVDERKGGKVTLRSMVKSKTMVLLTVAFSFIWFSVNALFWGLSYNSTNLAGNPYVNFGVGSAIEIPALVLSVILMNSRLGRRGALFLSMMVAAIVLIATIPIPQDLGVVATVFSMVGKFATSTAFSIVFLYTPEIYPTTFRSIGMGICGAIGRIGVICTPYVAMLATTGFQNLPLILLGGVSLMAALVTLSLPETKSVPLPDTLDDLKEIHSRMISCRGVKRRQGATSSRDIDEEQDASERKSMILLKERAEINETA